MFKSSAKPKIGTDVIQLISWAYNFRLNKFTCSTQSWTIWLSTASQFNIKIDKQQKVTRNKFERNTYLQFSVLSLTFIMQEGVFITNFTKKCRKALQNYFIVTIWCVYLFTSRTTSVPHETLTLTKDKDTCQLILPTPQLLAPETGTRTCTLRAHLKCTTKWKMFKSYS